VLPELVGLALALVPLLERAPSVINTLVFLDLEA
jgi:hypothetical protein